MNHKTAIRRIALAGLIGISMTGSASAQSTWIGGGVDANWLTAANWDTAPADGAALVFGTGFASGTTLTNNSALTSVGLLTFNTSLPAGGITLSGSPLTLTAGLTNSNTTAGRNVVINNNLTISGAQTWTFGNSNGITTIAGNLTGSDTITLGVGAASNSTTLPPLRLSGNNSGFTGTITTTGATSEGLLLASPAAMTGGLIDTSSGNRNLWLTGNSPASPYTFGTGNTAGTANVNFRNAGTAGLYFTGGDVYWDPGNGMNYTWAAGTNSQIRINGTNDSVRRMLFLGNDTSSLILPGNRSIINGSGGAFSGYVTMRSSLADDGVGRTFTTNTTLNVLTRAAGPGVLTGDTIVSGGALAVTNMDRIFNGWLSLSGIMVLDGVTWNTFMADQSNGYRASTGLQNTWGITGGGGGFAARNGNLNILIDANPSNAYGTITAGAVFNRDFTIGSAARNADNSYYATGDVTISQPTVLTGVRTIAVATTGFGSISGVPQSQQFNQTAVNYTISGNLSGTGAVLVTSSSSNNATPGVLVLAGSNTWTGGVSSGINTGVFFNSGAGGMNVSTSYVRFDGNGSFPTGNNSGATPAFLGAIQRNNSSQYGYLLTGSSTGQVYSLPANYQFLIGSMSTNPSGGVFGADLGKATLQGGSQILVHEGNAAGNSQSLTMLVRSGSELTLGTTAGGAVRFIPTTGQDGAAAAAATTVSDATGQRTLIKRGDGTLVLGNVEYKDLAGTDSALFTWQLGRGGNTNPSGGTSEFFDGAVRGLIPGKPGANSSNSITNTAISLRGAVYEIDNSSGTQGTFDLVLGTSAGMVNVGSTGGTTNQGGGGFAAFGNDVTVDLNGDGPTNLAWAANNSFFVQNASPLMFGSQTANRKLTFIDNINFAGNREIRVFDNPNSTTDIAELSGILSGASAHGFTKTGAGVLAITGNSNAYGGGSGGNTIVAAGTLLLNNTSGSATGNSPVIVNAGATVGGTGAITSALTVNTGGTVTNTITVGGLTAVAANANVIPGGINSVGTLTLNGGLTTTGASLVFDLSTPASSDMIDLGASGVLTSTGGLNAFTFAGTPTAGTYTLIDYGTFTGVLGDFSAPLTVNGFTAVLSDDTMLGAIVLTLTSGGGPDQWIGTGSWTTGANWQGAVPNSATAVASFLGMGTGTVTVDSAQAVNQVVFNAASPSYTIGGSSTLSLTGTAPTITNTAGSHTISAPLDLGTGTVVAVNGGTLSLDASANSVLASNVTATVASGATLNLGGAGNALSNGGSTHANVANSGTLAATTAGKRVGEISGSGTTTVTTAGATLTANHIRQSTLNIGAGNTVTVAANGGNSGTSVVTNLNINATGKLDLNDNDLVVDNGNLATLTAQLATGLDINGTYGNGPGITSTAFANNVDFNTVLGIAANVELGYTSFSGQTVDANDILIKYTYYGDADLSGSVDTSTDFDLYITGLTSGGSLGGWLFGDFDYSGTVDSSTDFDLYITGLTSQGSPLLTAAGGGNLVQAVPEPSTFVLGGLALLGFAGVGLRRRRIGRANETSELSLAISRK